MKRLERRRLEITIGTLVGVGLAIALLSVVATVPLLPILAATALGLLVFWLRSTGRHA